MVTINPRHVSWRHTMTSFTRGCMFAVRSCIVGVVATEPTDSIQWTLITPQLLIRETVVCCSEIECVYMVVVVVVVVVHKHAALWETVIVSGRQKSATVEHYETLSVRLHNDTNVFHAVVIIIKGWHKNWTICQDEAKHAKWFTLCFSKMLMTIQNLLLSNMVKELGKLTSIWCS